MGDAHLFDGVIPVAQRFASAAQLAKEREFCNLSISFVFHTPIQERPYS